MIPRPFFIPFKEITLALWLVFALTVPATAQQADTQTPPNTLLKQDSLPTLQKSKSGTSLETFRMLEMIQKKNRELKKREEELALREKNLKELEKQIKADLQKVEEALSRSEELVGIKRDLIEKNVNALVKVYSSMKPTEAAPLLEQMDEGIAIQIISKMKSKDAGKVLGKMNTQVAKNITEKIAGKSGKP